MLAGLLAAGMLALAAPAQADDDLPPGKIALSFGVRQGVGRLADDYGLGAVGAMEAAVHTRCVFRRVPCGVHWSVLWGWFGSDTASVAGSLQILEFNFGMRLRRPMSAMEPRFLAVGAGVSLLRANVPIPPDQVRSYVGPYMSVGFDQLIGSLLIGFEARYSMLITGPGSISLMLGVGIGS